MPRYAKETTVPMERTRGEIEKTLHRYNAEEFHYGYKPEAAMIAFRLNNLLIRFILPLPKRNERRFTHKKDRHGFETRRTDDQTIRAWDQEIRQRWRALLLVIKAKLEAVECGISSIEQEFLAFIVLPNDQTMGEWIISEAVPVILSGQMPRLALPAPAPSPPSEEVIDAEFETK